MPSSLHGLTTFWKTCGKWWVHLVNDCMTSWNPRSGRGKDPHCPPLRIKINVVSSFFHSPLPVKHGFSMGSTVFLGLVQTNLYCNVFFQTVNDNVHPHWWNSTSSWSCHVYCQVNNGTIQILTQKKCRSRTCNNQFNLDFATHLHLSASLVGSYQFIYYLMQPLPVKYI